MSEFNLEKLLEHLMQAQAPRTDIDHHQFCQAILEITHSLSFLGRAMSMAFSDIHSKANIILSNFENTSAANLKEMVMLELNSEKLKERSKQNPSTARTVLRLMWFLDFLSMLLSNLVNQRDWKMSKCCGEAYKQALAPHHSWKIRTAAKLGIKTLPTREVYLKNLLSHEDPELQSRQLWSILEAIRPIKDTLWEFYTEQGLTELP